MLNVTASKSPDVPFSSVPVFLLKQKKGFDTVSTLPLSILDFKIKIEKKTTSINRYL
jgi:hypothetical protein